MIGMSNKNIRDQIFQRDKRCLKCGTDKNLTIDHIVPLSKGGKKNISNLQTLCESCNVSKSDNIIDYRRTTNVKNTRGLDHFLICTFIGGDKYYLLDFDRLPTGHISPLKFTEDILTATKFFQQN